jgi:hypothetical protein
MRSMKFLSLFVLLSATLLLNSCYREEFGCTDPRATNFDMSAEIDDGSCFYGNDPEYGDCMPDAQGNLVISNHTGEKLYLYKGYTTNSEGEETFVTCIPADTAEFLIYIPNEELAVCLLQIWKASDVPDRSDPDIAMVHRQWRVALSNSTNPDERANWLITGLDDVTGTGTLFLSYPDTDEYGHEVIYQVDILLNSQGGSKLASLQPGIHNKMVSVDYGVQYLFFHYWYSDPNSSSGEITEIGWNEEPDIVINESHREAQIEIPVYFSIIGKYGELTVINENDYVINVLADGNLIENIAIVDGSTQGLSSIPAGNHTTFLIPVDKYSVTTQDLGGKPDDEFLNVDIIQSENAVLRAGIDNKSVRVNNSTDETLGLFNIQEEYLGLLIEPGKVSPDYVIPASLDTLLVMNFARTKVQGFKYSSTVTIINLVDYTLNRLNITGPWPLTDDYYESPVIGNDQDTSMTATLVNSETVILTFEYNVSSEAGYDVFSFKLDGNTEINGIGGETGWVSFSKAVGTGSHVLDWNYEKDPTRSEGRDNVRIRNIKIE